MSNVKRESKAFYMLNVLPRGGRCRKKEQARELGGT